MTKTRPASHPARWPLLLALALSPIPTPAESPTLSSLSPSEIAQGKHLFEGQCSACHGFHGEGGRGANLTLPRLAHAPDDASLIDVVQNGIPGSAMPGSFMTDREARLIAGYVRSLGHSPAAPPPGNPANGRAIFLTKANCLACHIVRGQGAAIGPDLTAIGARRSPAYLRNVLLDPAKSAPEDFLMVRAVTVSGERVTGIRVNEDTFTIQIKDTNNRFYSFAKASLAQLDRLPGTTPMPSYSHSLTPSELDDLTAYLSTLRGAP